MRIVFDEIAEISVELLLSAWHVLESQKLRFMDEAFTGVLFTQAELQRLYKVYEYLPALQDVFRCGGGPEIVNNNASREDSGAVTLSPVDTSGTLGSSVAPNIFDLAVDAYDFDCLVIESDDGDEVEVGQNFDDDDSDDHFVDDENKENEQPVKLKSEQNRDQQHPPMQLKATKRCNGLPFERLETLSQSVIRCFCFSKSLSKESFSCFFIIRIDCTKKFFLRFKECAH